MHLWQHLRPLEADGLHAVYSDVGVPLGIANDSFEAAIIQQNELNHREDIPFYGAKYDTWIVPANSDTFRKV